jgi:very-short-patch-repair endonuclease
MNINSTYFLTNCKTANCGDKLIQYLKIDDEYYFRFNNLLKLFYSFKAPGVGTQKSKIDCKNLFYASEKRGRYSCTYLNGDGVYQWVTKTRALLKTEKDDVINMLNSLQDKKTYTKEFSSSSEAMFISHLYDCAKELGFNIDRQVKCGKYSIDCVIDNIAIEYNENDHRTYNCLDEKERYDYIKNKGYTLVLCSSDDSFGKNIGKILKIWKHKY